MLRTALIASLVLGSARVCASPDANEARPAFADGVRPYVDAYCAACHSSSRPQGSLSFARYTNEPAVLADATVWRHVRDRMEDEEMPPRGMPRGDAVERARVLAWLRARIGPAEAPPVPKRRVAGRRSSLPRWSPAGAASATATATTATTCRSS